MSIKGMGFTASISNIRPYRAFGLFSDTDRNSKLESMMSSTAYYDEARRYKQLKADYNTVPNKAIKSQIDFLEESLLARYPAFLESKRLYPNALTMIGSCSL
jgi:hypothetical protein